VKLANVSKVLTSEAERTTLAILHFHYLMNKQSKFTKEYEKIFKYVIREPIRDIQNVLFYDNTESIILSFNTNKVVDKKLFELLTNDTCTMV